MWRRVGSGTDFQPPVGVWVTMAILCSAVPRSRLPRRTSTSKRSLFPQTSVNTERAVTRGPGIGRRQVFDVDLVADDGLIEVEQRQNRVVRGLLHEHDHGRGAELRGMWGEVFSGDGRLSFACQTGPDGRVYRQARRLRCTGESPWAAARKRE